MSVLLNVDFELILSYHLAERRHEFCEFRVIRERGILSLQIYRDCFQ